MVSKKRKSMEDMVDDPKEADRILSYVVGSRNKTQQHTITDFSSFKEAFRDAFQREGDNSHARLWDTLSGQDDLLLRLYGQANVQEKVTRDGRDFRTLEIMNTHHVPKREANETYMQERQHEIQLVKEGKIPPQGTRFGVAPELISPAAPSVRVRISQVTKAGGTIYMRSKPMKFTAPEKRFLVNKANLPSRKLTIEFNLLFKQNRTIRSVYNQRYRLIKGGE